MTGMRRPTQPLAATVSSLLGLVAFTMGNSGCADIAGCNLGGCTTRLVLIVEEPGGGAIAPGQWEFQLVLDGVESPPIACEVTEGSTGGRCDGDEPHEVAVNPLIVGGPGDPVSLFQLVVGEGSTTGDDLPDVVAVTVEHDGDLVVNAALEPNYQPVDPDCDEQCVDDRIELTVDRG